MGEAAQEEGPSVSASEERWLTALVIVNVLLQVFDGLATYAGLQVGYGEGNPIVAAAIGTVGPGTALAFFKVEACLCLLLVWALRHRTRLAAPALFVTASLYLMGSVWPWSAVLAPHYLIN